MTLRHGFASTLIALANAHRAQKQLTQAEQLYKQGLAIQEKMLGKDHSTVGQTLFDVGGLYGLQGRLDPAYKTYLRALGIQKKAVGPDHLQIAHVQHNLGELARARKSVDQAVSHYREAIRIYELRVGKDHLLVARSLLGYSATLRAVGRTKEAADLARKAVAQPGHPMCPTTSGPRAPALYTRSPAAVRSTGGFGAGQSPSSNTPLILCWGSLRPLR